MILDSEMHDRGNGAGRLSDHPDADQLRVIHVAELVVYLPLKPDWARGSKTRVVQFIG
jgi:hypothetical protein